MRHDTIEKSLNLMMVLIVVAISIGGLVEIVPLMMSSDATEPDEGIEVYSPLRLAGRDVYVREGCYNCHSQMIRPFRSETERYGPYTTAGETVYDRPFQFGSKRRRSMTVRSSSAPSAPARTSRASAVAIRTNGIACTWWILAHSCRSPTCHPIPGLQSVKSTVTW
jgi:hypothetical protein